MKHITSKFCINIFRNQSKIIFPVAFMNNILNTYFRWIFRIIILFLLNHIYCILWNQLYNKIQCRSDLIYTKIDRGLHRASKILTGHWTTVTELRSAARENGAMELYALLGQGTSNSKDKFDERFHRSWLSLIKYFFWKTTLRSGYLTTIQLIRFCWRE